MFMNLLRSSSFVDIIWFISSNYIFRLIFVYFFNLFNPVYTYVFFLPKCFHIVYSAILWLVLNTVDSVPYFCLYFLIHSLSIFPLVYHNWVFTLILVCVPEIKTANILEIAIGYPILYIKGVSASYVSHICNLPPTLIWIWIMHFYWVVLCDYTRTRGWLLSALLPKIWSCILPTKKTFHRAKRKN